MSSDTTDFNRNAGLTALYKTASIASLMVFLAGSLLVQQNAIKPTRQWELQRAWKAESSLHLTDSFVWVPCSFKLTHSPVNCSIAHTGKGSINVCAINTVFYILTSRRAFCNEFWVDYLPGLNIAIDLGYICECKILVKSDWMFS